MKTLKFFKEEQCRKATRAKMEVNADELAKTLLITEAKVQRETS